MKVTYDSMTDTLSVVFKSGSVAESDEEKPGIVLDYDKIGDLLGIEIMDASRRVPDLRNIHINVMPEIGSGVSI